MSTFSLSAFDQKLTIHSHGAQVLSWISLGLEQLYLSPDAIYSSSSSIRGGVPICFPQFGAFGPGQKHGSARNSDWQLLTQDSNRIQLGLTIDSFWKLVFSARLSTRTLCLTLDVTNTSQQQASFTAALHSYFQVMDIEAISISGLMGQSCWDNGTPFDQRAIDSNAVLKVSGPIDRVYFNTPGPISLQETTHSRHISSEGFSDTVIWNPWKAGAEQLQDMPNADYRRMICIESAVINQPITLAANESWQGIQRIEITD